MSRKRQQRRTPQVPRSTISTTEALPKVEERPVEAPRAVQGPATNIPRDSYAHVKGDLTRIAIFGTLIFAAMFGIKIMGLF